MDVKHVTPFLESFKNVMNQFGFSNVQTGNMSKKGKEIIASGLVLIVGIFGEIKGNVAYVINEEDSKEVASAMMMGMPVTTLDDMAKSAISELSNMLTANAVTSFSNMGIKADISPPSLFQGEDISLSMSSGTVLALQMKADNVSIEINISFE